MHSHTGTVSLLSRICVYFRLFQYLHMEVYCSDIDFNWRRPKWSLPSAKTKNDSNWILNTHTHTQTTRLQLYFQLKVKMVYFFSSLPIRIERARQSHIHTFFRCSSLCYVRLYFTETSCYWNTFFYLLWLLSFDYYVWMEFHNIVNALASETAVANFFCRVSCDKNTRFLAMVCGWIFLLLQSNWKPKMIGFVSVVD